MSFSTNSYYDRTQASSCEESQDHNQTSREEEGRISSRIWRWQEISVRVEGKLYQNSYVHYSFNLLIRTVLFLVGICAIVSVDEPPLNCNRRKLVYSWEWRERLRLVCCLYVPLDFHFACLLGLFVYFCTPSTWPWLFGVRELVGNPSVARFFRYKKHRLALDHRCGLRVMFNATIAGVLTFEKMLKEFCILPDGSTSLKKQIVWNIWIAL